MEGVNEQRARGLANGFAKTVNEGRQSGCNDSEIALGVGIFLAKLASTAEDVENIADFARRHIGKI